MSKDPAFLFYSTDFYEGTRTMLPEERACYIDLLIYQHQRGVIPNDLKRVALYCNGISEATLEATLKAKFKLTPEGWINERLNRVMQEREDFSVKQSINGVVGQFWKKAKATLKSKEYDSLKDALKGKANNQLFEEIKDLEINEATLKAMLKALLKHYRDEDRDRDVIIIEDKNLIKLDIYSFDEFWNDYSKKVGDKEKLIKKWEKLSVEDKLKIKAYIPQYILSQPEKSYRKNPETFLNNRGWEDELIFKTKPNENRHREVSAIAGRGQGSSTL